MKNMPNMRVRSAVNHLIWQFTSETFKNWRFLKPFKTSWSPSKDWRSHEDLSIWSIKCLRIYHCVSLIPKNLFFFVKTKNTNLCLAFVTLVRTQCHNTWTEQMTLLFDFRYFWWNFTLNSKYGNETFLTPE